MRLLREARRQAEGNCWRAVPPFRHHAAEWSSAETRKEPEYQGLIPAGRLTIEQKHSADGIVKAGELIEIRQSSALTLHDRRVLNLLIEHAGPGIAEDVDHHIAMWRLRGPHHRGGERVRDSVLRLMDTRVEVPTKDSKGNRATKYMHLLSDTTTTDDEDNPGTDVDNRALHGRRAGNARGESHAGEPAANRISQITSIRPCRATHNS